MQKPTALFDRDVEWSKLVGFVRSEAPGHRLGLVYGRRRQGKSVLLSALCRESGGFYWEALDGESIQNLASISAAWSAWRGLAEPVRFASWKEVVDALMSAGRVAGRRIPVVLDEIPRVINRVREFPSLLQHALGPGARVEGDGVAFVLCGSAFGEMRRLIDGPAPLRGRASLELLVQPFDYRESAAYWRLGNNPAAAFALHAYVGGTPAYLTLADFDRPDDGDVDAWVRRRLLDPASSLFRDGRIVVAEDAQLGEQQRYWGLLSAIAGGARTWSDLEQALGYERGSLRHALDVAIDSGWVERLADPLRRNRSTYVLAEPMVRFFRLVTEPNMQRLDARRSRDVWRDARPTVAARILAPHLERLTLQWLVRYAADTTVGGALMECGPTRFADAKGDTCLDFAVTEATARGSARPIAIGEVKSTDARVGIGQLVRLDDAAERLDGGSSPGCRRLLVSRAGFTTELERAAAGRSDVELIDLQRLYHGT